MKAIKKKQCLWPENKLGKWLWIALYSTSIHWSSCHIYTIILLLKRLATSEWIFIHTTDMQLHIGLPVLCSRSTLLAQINPDVYLRQFAGKFVFAIFKLHSWFFAISRMLRLLTKWRKLASAMVLPNVNALLTLYGVDCAY